MRKFEKGREGGKGRAIRPLVAVVIFALSLLLCYFLSSDRCKLFIFLVKAWLCWYVFVIYFFQFCLLLVLFGNIAFSPAVGNTPHI